MAIGSTFIVVFVACLQIQPAECETIVIVSDELYYAAKIADFDCSMETERAGSIEIHGRAGYEISQYLRSWRIRDVTVDGLACLLEGGGTVP